jgi:hypothetical protein
VKKVGLRFLINLLSFKNLTGFFIKIMLTAASPILYEKKDAMINQKSKFFSAFFIPNDYFLVFPKK